VNILKSMNISSMRTTPCCSRATDSSDAASVDSVPALPPQLGAKGFGDPVTFDNAYYTALQSKPWTGAPADSMAAMIGLPSDKVRLLLPRNPPVNVLQALFAQL